MAIAVVAFAAAALAASGTPRVLSCSGHPLSKPASYVITCADANVQWKSAHWSSWTATRATAHGNLYENDCTPNCAAGRFHTYASTIDPSKPVQTKKYGRLFSKAAFHYGVAGKAKTVTWLLGTSH